MNSAHDLYTRYAPALYGYARALTGNAAEAEDLVADTFVRLWASPGEIREATVKAFLFTVLRNLFLSRRRRTRREVPLDDSLADAGQPQDARAAANVDLARVHEQLARMSDVDRQALLMRGEGESYERIGAALHLSAGAARVRVHRARILLTKAIGDA